MNYFEKILKQRPDWLTKAQRTININPDVAIRIDVEIDGSAVPIPDLAMFVSSAMESKHEVKISTVWKNY